MDLELTGRRAIVTGGSRGIGYAIARRLLDEGCAVGICARDKDGVDAAVRALAEGGQAWGATCDVTDDSDVESFVRDAAAALGGMDFVVANAGGAFGGPFLASTPDDWLRTYDLNLVHAVRTLRAAIPHLERSPCASAVMIGSISGSRPSPPGPYAAAKAAQAFLAGALAWELASHRIRVNTIAPGSIMFDGGGWGDLREREPERIDRFVEAEFPWGRMGRPEEVADVVAFALSARSSWLTGAVIPVDGGQVGVRP